VGVQAAAVVFVMAAQNRRMGREKG
jgi:hypothetical protein